MTNTGAGVGCFASGSIQLYLDRIIPRARNTNLPRYLSRSSRRRAAIMRIWLSSSAVKVTQKASSKKFVAAAKRLWEGAMQYEPYKTYKDRFPMYMHYVRHRIKRTVPLMDMTVHFSMYGERIYP